MKTYVVINDNFEREFMTIKDSIVEDYIDEKIDEDFEEVMRDLFSEWCRDEFGWRECSELWEITNLNPAVEFEKIF